VPPPRADPQLPCRRTIHCSRHTQNAFGYAALTARQQPQAKWGLLGKLGPYVRLKATRNIRTLSRPQRRSQTRLRCSRRTLRTRAPPQRIKLPRYQRVGEFRVFLLRTALVGALKTSARQGGCDFGQRLSAAVTILGPLRPVRRNFPVPSRVKMGMTPRFRLRAFRPGLSPASRKREIAGVAK
jgi:hypothetical protein